MRLFTFVVLYVALLSAYFSQPEARIEPPFWWTGMKEGKLQLMVHAPGIANTSPHLVHPGVKISGVVKPENPDYLFVDLDIGPDATPGRFMIDFLGSEQISCSFNYELLARDDLSADRKGFGPEDVIYLIMPDRFANGEKGNDNMPGMLEAADRTDPDGRHGGDLKGIVKNLDYIEDMGYTAIWLNPVLENNNPEYSYHGYAITDFYRVDPRIGTNDEYVEFVRICHDNGIKVIMDMVFNHCGYGHWWMDDLPSADWIHQWPEFTRSNFRAPVNSDPHASTYDKRKMEKGWFDTNMPDLNQNNELLANYLIQNSIWWVEYAGLDGIRMDTYPYSDQEFMAKWMHRIREEYPSFNIVGEAWLQKEAITAYYAESERQRFGYNSSLPSVTDFPMHYALAEAFNEDESWTEGLARLYYVLAQDFLFDHPSANVIFLDNHDLDRYFSSVGGDIRKFRMGMAFILTTRGTPMIYYGTEILMEGEEHSGHGYIRQDFPGGWKGDSINVFKGKGLAEQQKEALDFTGYLLQWRKNSPAVQNGELIHFIPDDGIYVYFRLHPDQKVMVLLNNRDEEKNMPVLERFDECLTGKRSAYDVLHKSRVENIQGMVLPPKSVTIFEIR